MATHSHSDAFLKKARRLGKFLNALSAVSPRLAGRIAFRVFCSPRRQALRNQDRSFLVGAWLSDFMMDRIPIRVYEWPVAKPIGTVLFLHGWESNSARWRKFIKPLNKKGYRVMAFDAPAHGNSGGKLLNLPLYSRAVKTFMQHYGVPDAIVGHSLGAAAVVMSMAVFETPHVRKAVLMAAFAESSRVMRDFGNILGLNETVLHQLNREIERRSGIPIEAYSIKGKAPVLADVQGLVMHDRDDDVAPVSEGIAIAEAWPAEFIETQGFSHRMQDKSVVEAVVRFIAG